MSDNAEIIEALRKAIDISLQRSVANELLIISLVSTIVEELEDPSRFLRILREEAEATVSAVELAPSDTARAMENRRVIREAIDVSLSALEHRFGSPG